MYPDYLDFMMDYVNMAVSRINENSPSGTDMKNSFKIRREISPSPGFADMANYKDLNTVYSCYGPDQAANVLGYVFETTGNREIKNEISGLMPELTKLCNGEPAPPIALKDCDGKDVYKRQVEVLLVEVAARHLSLLGVEHEGEVPAFPTH